MNKEQCRLFERCEAQLCPLDTDSLPYAIFYPDEPICNRRTGKPAWVKVQRRIQKRVKDRESYYTIEMLESISQVRAGTRGLDPEGRRLEDVFLARRRKSRESSTMPVFGQKTAFLTSEKKDNPQNIGKDTPAKQLTFI